MRRAATRWLSGIHSAIGHHGKIRIGRSQEKEPQAVASRCARDRSARSTVRADSDRCMDQGAGCTEANACRGNAPAIPDCPCAPPPRGAAQRSERHQSLRYGGRGDRPSRRGCGDRRGAGTTQAPAVEGAVRIPRDARRSPDPEERIVCRDRSGDNPTIAIAAAASKPGLRTVRANSKRSRRKR